ncbi:MAG TPA: helix-turn-helix transcriptional regulator [Gammaproteobacteria bacterium]|nr:helix-turn-helix transcriptional regulator [Gammaproteobacteria bacterium]
MTYATEQIASALKAARKGKGLSQRALAKLAGVPQSHISKIESGAVDLRLSSLVEIARALDLEVTLVPKKHLAAVQSIVRSSEQPARQGAPDPSSSRELRKLQDSLGFALHEYPAVKELAQLQRQVRELQRLAVPLPDPGPLREATKAVQAITSNTGHLNELRRALSSLQHLRNALVHEVPRVGTVKPAYGLEEDDHG